MSATPDQPPTPGGTPTDPNANLNNDPNAPTAPSGPSKRDLLKASPAEQAELEKFIAKGHSAHSTIFLLSLFGIIVFALGLLYWNHLDYTRVNGELVRFGSKQLPMLLRNQTDKDWQVYQPRRDIRAKPKPASWPQEVYRKLRFDSYVISGLALILALIMIHVEKTKMRRNDLLVFRAMAREVEKLRIRVRQLEGKKKSEDKPPTA